MLPVGEIPEGICLVDCELLHQSLPEAPLILRVTPVAELEQHFGRSIHKVVVRQTFVSEDVSVGDDISVTATGTFADANVGSGKEVTITGLTLTGNDAEKYRLAESGQQTSATASTRKAMVCPPASVPVSCRPRA